MMKSPWHNVFDLFFPPACPVCGAAMGEGTALMCTRCRMEIPLTGYERRIDNPVAQKLYGLVPVVNACAFMFYTHDSGYVRLVTDFKYRGNWRFARDAGEWFGAELRDSGLYDDVDLLVPVPLHRMKFLRRGYNQSEYLAEGMSHATGIAVDRRSVVRTVNTESQASKHRDERWDNVEDIFRVRRPEALAGKHLLLVDDVFTTGATLVSLAGAILQAAPTARISVAALAVSKAQLKVP